MEPELSQKLTRFSLTVSDEVKAVRTLVNGNKLSLSLLDTQAKSNLVAAINEIFALVQGDTSYEEISIAVNDYFVLHPVSFIFTQDEPRLSWLVLHPLDHNPAVVITDSAGSRWVGQVTYPAANQVLVQFNTPLAGKAVLT